CPAWRGEGDGRACSRRSRQEGGGRKGRQAQSAGRGAKARGRKEGGGTGSGRHDRQRRRPRRSSPQGKGQEGGRGRQGRCAYHQTRRPRQSNEEALATPDRCASIAWSSVSSRVLLSEARSAPRGARSRFVSLGSSNQSASFG